MSSVHKRFRKETELQFMIDSQNLQIEITKFVMKEKFVPKKWRLIIGQPLIQKVDELLDNLNYANSIFPTNEFEYKRRADYQSLAVCNCRQLHNKLYRMVMCIETVKIENLEQISKLLVSAETLIKNWKKSDKERFKSFIEHS